MRCFESRQVRVDGGGAVVRCFALQGFREAGVRAEAVFFVAREKRVLLSPVEGCKVFVL